MSSAMFGLPQHSFAPPSVLPDISPSGGEIMLSLERPPVVEVSGWAGRTKLPISPLEGEMSGRTEGGNVELKLSASSLFAQIAGAASC